MKKKSIIIVKIGFELILEYIKWKYTYYLLYITMVIKNLFTKQLITVSNLNIYNYD